MEEQPTIILFASTVGPVIPAVLDNDGSMHLKVIVGFLNDANAKLSVKTFLAAEPVLFI